MSALDELRRARARIAKGWTQGAFARDAAGRAVDANAVSAIAWDVMGALGDWSENAHIEAALRLLSEVVGGSVSLWNDTAGRTQAEVLAAFDRCISLAQRHSEAEAARTPAAGDAER